MHTQKTAWKRISAAIAAILAMTMVGCGTSDPSKAAESRAEEPKTSFSVTDSFGHKVDFKTRPQRVCLLSATLLSIWYDLGGTAACTPSLTGNEKLQPAHAAAIKKVPKVGMIYAVNLERILATNPDLVIAPGAVSQNVTDKLSSQGIPVLNIKTRSLDEVLQTYQTLGKVLSHTKEAKKRSSQISAQVKSTVNKMPADGKRVAILFATATSISLKLNNSIAGSMAKLLKLKNIASSAIPDDPNAETATLSVEKITQQQPDIIMVTSMVQNNALARQIVNRELTSNPAWQAVDAVRKKKIIYLPQQYFLFNGGPNYPDSVAYMAASVHPEIFGKPIEP